MDNQENNSSGKKDNGGKGLKGKSDSKIIYFPDLDRRDDIAKSLKKAKEEREQKARLHNENIAKEQQKRANIYRSEYANKNPHPAIIRARNTLGDARKSTTKEPFINWQKIPIFTRAIIALMLLVHIGVTFLADDLTRLNIFFNFSLTPARFTGNVPWDMLYAFSPMTSLFLHSGWFHLGMNAVMMLITGVFFERQFGAKSTLIVFIVCGIAGHLGCIAINPYSEASVIGASGAINGLFALTFMLMIYQGLMGPILQTRGPGRFILLWLAIIISVGLLSENISWQSHLGGFLAGVAIFYLWKNKKIRL